MSDSVRVAAVQAAPVYLDRDATIDRVVALVEEAGANGAQLIVFGEAFVPGYPDWAWRTNPWHDAAWFDRLQDQAVVVPSEATDRLGDAARAAGAVVVVGIDERDLHGSTLYNSMLYLDVDGSVLGTHRKLMPSGGERLVWGFGDGSDLGVHDTAHGRIGGLICWENYMPLARAALYGQGLDVYLAPDVGQLRHLGPDAAPHRQGRKGPRHRHHTVPARNRRPRRVRGPRRAVRHRRRLAESREHHHRRTGWRHHRRSARGRTGDPLCRPRPLRRPTRSPHVRSDRPLRGEPTSSNSRSTRDPSARSPTWATNTRTDEWVRAGYGRAPSSRRERRVSKCSARSPSESSNSAALP